MKQEPIESRNCIVRLSRFEKKKKVVYKVKSGPAACKFKIGEKIEMNIGTKHNIDHVWGEFRENCTPLFAVMVDDFPLVVEASDPNKLYVDVSAVWAP